jgi:hypothetical protein
MGGLRRVRGRGLSCELLRDVEKYCSALVSVFGKDGVIECVFVAQKEEESLALERHACCE